VTFPTTLTDHCAGFQGHGIFEIQYLKNGASLGTKLLLLKLLPAPLWLFSEFGAVYKYPDLLTYLQNTNRKLYPVCRMVPLSMTLSDLRPGFQGHDIFRHWISRKWHATSYWCSI